MHANSASTQQEHFGLKCSYWEPEVLLGFVLPSKNHAVWLGISISNADIYQPMGQHSSWWSKTYKSNLRNNNIIPDQASGIPHFLNKIIVMLAFSSGQTCVSVHFKSQSAHYGSTHRTSLQHHDTRSSTPHFLYIYPLCKAYQLSHEWQPQITTANGNLWAWLSKISYSTSTEFMTCRCTD